MTFLFFITLVYLFIWIQYLPVIAAFWFNISRDFKSVFMTYLLNMNSLNGPKMCPGAGEALTPPWSVASDLTDDLTTDVAWRRNTTAPQISDSVCVFSLCCCCGGWECRCGRVLTCGLTLDQQRAGWARERHFLSTATLAEASVFHASFLFFPWRRSDKEVNVAHSGIDTIDIVMESVRFTRRLLSPHFLDRMGTTSV